MNPSVVIQPSRNSTPVNFKELWNRRELTIFFALRDVKVRYKQTALGVAWVLLQPALTMIIFAFFFGRLAKLPSDGVPYPLFTLSALIVWMFFSNTLAQATNSVVFNARVITKMYFPRAAVPASTILSGLLDLSVACTLLIPALLFYRFAPSAHAIYAPLFVALAIVICCGVSLWLSALNVLYRDVQYAVPFLLQLWMYCSPVLYPASLLGKKWSALYGLNPMVAPIEGFRWALLGTPFPSSLVLLESAVIALVVLATGSIYFRRAEKRFADIL